MCVAFMFKHKDLNALNPSSNWGERVDVAAYGTKFYTGRDKYGKAPYGTGSSIATPTVSGISAILLSMSVEPDMVKRRIMANTDPIYSFKSQGEPQTLGGGALDALETVKHAISRLHPESRALRGIDRLVSD
ncbi:hypothetical protein FOZ63_026330 [Perkinsus olseni]|uniref:subtilisin n=1 Tax=Perkinsus olseni TaxID=32597 RepID=A0A7J6TQC8_PEROL|nr:hypothetical protein FOZ60_007478 [Perkinsus olseni]KAF4708899.1 hypothetical protein FOZ63_026330 [Perkinsus olseni]KAF4747548.1 hypothetical protein FOZ62_016335 [Perkinsus olseni]